MKAIQLIIFIIILFANTSFSQNALFVLHQDNRIVTLYNHKDSFVCRFPGFPVDQKVDGYRVLVIKTDDRDFAYEIKHKLLENDGGYNVYMSYQTPFFIIKSGDFISRQAAENFSYRINREFNFNTTVVIDKVYQSKVSKEEQPCLDTAPFPNYL